MRRGGCHRDPFNQAIEGEKIWITSELAEGPPSRLAAFPSHRRNTPSEIRMPAHPHLLSLTVLAYTRSRLVPTQSPRVLLGGTQLSVSASPREKSENATILAGARIPSPVRPNLTEPVVAHEQPRFGEEGRKARASKCGNKLSLMGK